MFFAVSYGGIGEEARGARAISEFGRVEREGSARRGSRGVDDKARGEGMRDYRARLEKRVVADGRIQRDWVESGLGCREVRGGT